MNLPTFRAVCIGLAAAVGFGTLALAGPPLVTDDPETPGRGGWEINISNKIEKTRGELRMETPLIDINYGWPENDQWKIEFPLLLVDQEGDEGHFGVGDLLLGWKYRFWDEEEQGFMASVYPQQLIPTGNERLGLGEGNYELLLPIEIGKHFCEDKLFAYAEAGYKIAFGDAPNEWIYGVAVQWQHSEELEVMFELAGRVSDGRDEPDFAFFNVGLQYKLSDHWSFIGSAGRSFRSSESGAPELLTFVGLQFTRGGKDNENDKEKSLGGGRSSSKKSKKAAAE